MTKCFLGVEAHFNIGTVKFNIVDDTYTDLSTGFQLDVENHISSSEATIPKIIIWSSTTKKQYGNMRFDTFILMANSCFPETSNICINKAFLEAIQRLAFVSKGQNKI